MSTNSIFVTGIMMCFGVISMGILLLLSVWFPKTEASGMELYVLAATFVAGVAGIIWHANKHGIVDLWG
ncbi:MAG: hypothetical protein MPL62_17430 [Alphaproteobacteria bacterium]|nr:hypothetical protein [Alphaproteobacteria bacterium]